MLVEQEPWVERRPPVPLPGEALETAHWEDAQHWLRVYGDLLAFNRTILDQIRAGLPALHVVAQAAAAEDLEIIRIEMEAYQARLDLWYQRVWDLQGLWLDSDTRVIRHHGVEATLTRREYQLLRFLIDRPHRFFNTYQLALGAWADGTLSPATVRASISRVRQVLASLDVPADIVNRPRRGYTLVFRTRDRRTG